MMKVKLLVVGPVKSGKTFLSNFLADATDSSSGEYQPTQGVRIIEFESGNLNVGKKNTKVDVELWDCGGDLKFENCWAAMAKDAHGVIFVFNSDRVNAGSELERFYAYFVHHQGLRDNQCLIMSHNKASGASRRSVSKPPSSMSNVPVVVTNLDDDGDQLRTAFSFHLRKLLQILMEKQNQEEEIIAGV